ncbi:MAG: 4-(cytidine 5'-diphospho)-2-C-methyl-D-erythritol kinase [Helicobacteraceae bacterium]|jgi:4-diphosphocytidyl-2-C-methyl-D-erythritol kinase|nr:4-(cytidine 5'-diphospho)-2-C-methyl-D-erythritol kinase [Helicobacteraceae bacterium]
MHKVWAAEAKINIFLKLIGRREDGYHLIASRFVRIRLPTDQMWFENAGLNGFEVIGDFPCKQEDNTISRALALLIKLYPSRRLSEFAASHKVVVYKQIPYGAGLGGGSSNAATFLLMINETAKLGLRRSDLIKVGVGVGADVPFFISGVQSANVGGIGEEITQFDEPPLKIELKTVPIACETANVYKTFRLRYEDHNMGASGEQSKELLNMNSIDILQSRRPEELNDLFVPAFKSYPELNEFYEDGWFMSGSGSAFFRIAR